MSSCAVALRGSAVRIGTTSSKFAISFSMPTMATWIFGSVVTSRALPSLVMMTRLPVSATAMFAPVMPMSALRNFVRSFAAGELHQLRDVGRLARFDLFAEDVGDLFLGHVDGRHHHVRRGLAGELNDPLAEVGLADLDAGLLEMLDSDGFPPRPSTSI